MAIGILTVIGLLVLLGITTQIIMHYISKALISRDSEIIDPKPTTNY